MSLTGVRERTVGVARSAETHRVNVLHLMEILFITAVLVEIFDALELGEDRGTAKVLALTGFVIAELVGEPSRQVNGVSKISALAAGDAPRDQGFPAITAAKSTLLNGILKLTADSSWVGGISRRFEEMMSLAADVALREAIGHNRIIAWTLYNCF